MTPTVKQYTTKYDERKELKNQADNARYSNEWDTHHKLQQQIAELDKWFETIDTVNVSFLIGSRSYSEAVVKIGKSYFKHGQRMTQGRGYWCIEEIGEITEEMQKQMLADSYYY